MGEVIVITSGKGGVGKTTTTANIGAGLSQLGNKVVVIDTDLGLRNLEDVYKRQDQYELERLRELYKLDENYSDYQKVGAHVISNNGTNWFNDFTIDKGSNDGKMCIRDSSGAGRFLCVS